MPRFDAPQRAILVASLTLLAGLTWVSSAAQEKVVAVSDDVYSSFGPSSNVIDQAVTARYPAWEPFRQTVMDQSLTIGNIFEQASFGGPEYGVNPAVLLIVVGMDLDWQPPADGDLFGQAVEAASTLHPFYVDFYTEEQVRAAYPHIGNASTYALYRYFEEDLEELETWCRTYQSFFGQDHPLRP